MNYHTVSRCQILLASSLAVAATIAFAQAPSQLNVALLTLDMPHGACRLTIMTDGAANLAYGALPGRIDVRPGTFEPRPVVSLFRSLSKPEASRAGMKPPIGAVTFHPSNELLWFNAAAPAQALFRRALQNRSPAQSNLDDPEAEAIIVKACSAA